MTPESFMDHLPNIITAIGMVWIGWRQLKNTKTIVTRIETVEATVKSDIGNGLGEAVAAKTAQHLAPALEQAATVAADKIVKTAEDVAAVLADKVNTWNGEERRTGKSDRRES